MPPKYTVKSNKLHVNWLVSALAKLNNRFCEVQTTRDKLKDELAQLEDGQLLTFPSLKGVLGGNVYFHAIATDKLILSILLNPKRFEESDFHQEFIKAEGLANETERVRLVMSVHQTENDHLIVRRVRGAYDGPGGIHLKGESWKDAFLIEPFEHWFRSRLS